MAAGPMPAFDHDRNASRPLAFHRHTWDIFEVWWLSPYTRKAAPAGTALASSLFFQATARAYVRFWCSSWPFCASLASLFFP